MIAGLRDNVQQHRVLLAILMLGLTLRLLWVLVFNADIKLVGGDGEFYVRLASAIASGQGFSIADIPTVGPVYPLFLSIFIRMYPSTPATALTVARVSDVLISTGTLVVVYWLAMHYYGRRAGLLAAGLMAIDLRFVVESGNIQTETLFMFVFLLSIALYERQRTRDSTYTLTLPGIAFAVAGLTRAIALAMPALAGLHQLIMRPFKNAFVRMLWFAGAFALALVPWLTYNYISLGRLAINEGAASNFWLGSQGEGQWEGQTAFVEAIDTLPRPEDAPGGNPTSAAYVQSAVDNILADPPRYVRLLATKLARAYVQPAGPVLLGGPSIKQNAQAWLAGQNTLADLIQTPAFWPKLWMYICHFGTLGLTLVSTVVWRKNWRHWLFAPLVIVYLSSLYTLLTIIPRYIFPIMPLYIVLASGAVAWWLEKRADDPLAAHLQAPLADSLS